MLPPYPAVHVLYTPVATVPGFTEYVLSHTAPVRPIHSVSQDCTVEEESVDSTVPCDTQFFDTFESSEKLGFVKLFNSSYGEIIAIYQFTINNNMLYNV